MDKSRRQPLVHFTTDMIYGHTVHCAAGPRTIRPSRSANTARASSRPRSWPPNWRDKGMRISIFRPRLIIGPGRLGILVKLFKLID